MNDMQGVNLLIRLESQYEEKLSLGFVNYLRSNGLQT